MVRGTSRSAYNNEVKHFKNKLYTIILSTLNEIDKNNEGATRGEIANYSKMEKSTVSARVNEMLKKGMLQEVGKRKCKFSKILSYTIAIHPSMQGNDRLF